MPLKPHIQSFRGGEEKPAHNLCKHEPKDDIRNRNAQARWGLSLGMNGSQLWVLWCTASVWLKSCHPEMSGGPRRGRGSSWSLALSRKRGRKGLQTSKTRWPSASGHLNKFKSNGHCGDFLFKRKLNWLPWVMSVIKLRQSEELQCNSVWNVKV